MCHMPCHVCAGRRYAEQRVPPRFRLQGANSTESLAGKEGGRATSEVGVWGPERSRPSAAESDLGSAFSAPDGVYAEVWPISLVYMLSHTACLQQAASHALLGFS